MPLRAQAWNPRRGSPRAKMALYATALLVVICAMTACSNSKNGNAAAASGTPAGTPTSWAGTTPAPAFPTGLTWFNVDHPLKLSDLKGKAVLLDFWTLGCINCQDIIPDLKKLESDFGNSFTVIGVHSGKYSTEHDNASIEDAIKKFGLTHPVVNDPDFAIWQAYNVNAWPTLVLIDPNGKLVGAHAGEGVYPLFHPIISSLISEFAAKGEINKAALPLSLNNTTPSTVLSYPGAVLADPQGNRLFIADSSHNRILISDLSGKLEQAIGSGKQSFDDGAAAEATFNGPQGLALSPDGKTLYVADTRNHAIRSVNLATFEVTTIAGTGQQLDTVPKDGTKATSAAMSSPWGLAVDGNTLYITMAGVHQIWAMDLKAGTVSVFAGTTREGIDDGERLQATLAQPSGLVTDHSGANLYWVDPESSSVRTVPTAGDGKIKTLVGTGLFDYGDNDGTGTSAKLQHAQAIALGDGVLYLADTYNHKIRALNLSTDTVTTLAGNGTRGWNDGTGKQALFDEPSGLSFAAGKLYVADTNNDLIRVIDVATNTVSTLTLTNLSVAAPVTAGRSIPVALSAQKVAPGAANLRIQFNAPSGYHLNNLAPSRITLSSSNPAVIDLGEKSLTWSVTGPSVSLPVPVSVHPGTATITGTASVYYCRTGQDALCFIQQLEITLPVTITAGANAGEITMSYALPTVAQ
ncbi:MAG TPA: thioredoxin-like domain-containing protein [Tepidiformaceae bacterium]|nr:thioredoxin-like domain-containing protein [Tepidiformaceae bacterium]